MSFIYPDDEKRLVNRSRLALVAVHFAPVKARGCGSISRLSPF